MAYFRQMEVTKLTILAAILGSIHTNPGIFETAYFVIRIRADVALPFFLYSS